MSKITPEKISEVTAIISRIDAMESRALIVACCHAMDYDVDAENLTDYINAKMKGEDVLCKLIRKIVKDDTGLEDEITKAFDNIDGAFFFLTQETKQEPHKHSVSCGL